MTKTKQGKRYSHVVKVPGLQTTMTALMPVRTANEVYLNDTIDCTEALRWLEKKNEGKEKGERITLFHCVITALTKMVHERPKMNYYVKTCRVYEREEISMSFVVKKKFADNADEELMFLVPDLNDNAMQVSNKILAYVNRARSESHGGGSVNDVLDWFGSLPRIFQMIVAAVVRFTDYWQITPHFLTDDDPNFSTILLSNLGSIKCPAVYHHINDYGTNCIMITIGTIHKAPVLQEDGTTEIRDVVDIGATLDERIADGFYFARSLKLVKHIFAHPEMLEAPINEPSGFDYK